MKQQCHILININLLYCLASIVALANLFEEFQIKFIALLNYVKVYLYFVYI